MQLRIVSHGDANKACLNLDVQHTLKKFQKKRSLFDLYMLLQKCNCKKLINCFAINEIPELLAYKHNYSPRTRIANFIR